MVCLYPKRRCTRVYIKNESTCRVGMFLKWTHGRWFRQEKVANQLYYVGCISLA